MNQKREPSYRELKRRLALEAARQAYIKQVLRVIRQANQLILHENDPKRLIERACTILTGTPGYHTAWLALLDEAGVVTTIASSGFEAGFEAMRDRLERGDFPARIKQTLEQEEMMVVNQPPADCPLGDKYAGRAGLTRRLAYGDRVYGILAVSVPAAYAHDAEAQELFDELAGVLAFALRSIESQARRESIERKYAAVLTTTRDAVIGGDLEGNITLFNPGAEQLFECSAEEALGGPVSRFCPEDRLEEQAEMLRRVRETRSVRLYETERLTAGGRRVPVEMTLSLHTDDQGKPIGVGAILRDITERRQAEAALRESEERYRRLASLTSDYIYALRVESEGDLVVEWRTEGFTRITGYPAKISDQRSMLPQLIHPDDAPLVRRHLEACLSNRKDVVESRIVTNDGEIRWVRDYLEPDWDEKQGRVVRLYGATQDITARKQAEEALRASEERLRRLVESTNDLVILQDLEGHYLYYNGPSQYGLEVDDVLGTTPYDWLPVDVADQIMDRMRQVAADRKKTTWEQGVVWKGETLWFLNSNFPVYDEAGRIAAIGTISHDITERKQAEVERERLVQELQTALAQVKQLKSLLPICSSCKKIRDDEGYWHQVEVYIAQHAGVDFSHGLCPDCKLKLYPPIQYPFLYEEEP